MLRTAPSIALLSLAIVAVAAADSAMISVHQDDRILLPISTPRSRGGAV